MTNRFVDPPCPRQRLVALGASNLAMGFSRFVQVATSAWNQPLDVLAALGHGRSYGRESWVLGRGLPGIAHCGLWDALAQRPALPAWGLLTDVGNDLLYGVPVEQIADWVRLSVARLKPVCQQLVLTSLPLATVGSLRPWQYYALRSVFFPRSSLSYSQALSRAEQLNEQLLKLAEQESLRVVAFEPAWYRFDAIHLRRSRYSDAWRRAVSCVHDPRAAQASVPWTQWWRLHTLCPEQRRLLGFHQQRPQPAARLRDGTQVSLY